MKKLLYLFLTSLMPLYAAIDFEQMTCDLELVRWIDTVLESPLPLSYNYIFSTGYFVTPSARMSAPGVIGVGYGQLPPYTHYNALVQPFSHLEFSVNWRMFRGVEDPQLSAQGFGDFADRGANIKISLVTPEDSNCLLPGIAFGIEDFLGSKRFTTYYAVATQVWQSAGLEMSWGWGTGRYQDGPSRGFFGGISWYPFFCQQVPFIRGLAFMAEYDPIDYTQEVKEPHPNARSSNFPINFGLQYNFCDLIQCSLSCWRGKEAVMTASLTYNWGATTGLLPRIDDPPLFCTPYPSHFTQHQICDSFRKQGLILQNSYLCDDLVILTVTNCMWIREKDMRYHLAHLLALFPYQDVKHFIVIIRSHNLDCQSYYFDRRWLESYCKGEMGGFEFDLLTSRKEPFSVDSSATPLYCASPFTKYGWLEPRFETFFGSAKGKFKYDVGLQLTIEGALPYHFFYEAKASITALSSIQDVSDFDCYNPSQLPNVATDYINYRKQGHFSADRLYIQALQNLPCGFFAKLSVGYFQINYAGVGTELLWYPANSCLAVGVEAALLKKRAYNGLGFQSTLRVLEGYTPTYHHYSVLDQYFIDIYYDLPECSFFTKLSLGGFLAKDKGARLEITRYFQSGLRLTGWISVTDANDTMHSVRYFDRGIAIEIPMEVFYKKSCRRVFNYGLAAWLRDAGYRSSLGRSLFDIINRERRF